MMPAKHFPPQLIDRLPSVRGRIEANASLARYSWFKTGGPAEVLFQPEDADDLAAFLKAKPTDVALTVIGVASNIIVRDGGVEGVVVRIGRGFADIEQEQGVITAGAGAPDINVARKARDLRLAGLEFLSGIPGTIGGGVRMNAGAYGREFKDVILDADALDGQGNRHRLDLKELGLGYRHCAAPEDWIFVSARLRGEPGDREDIDRRMREISDEREKTQPVKTLTGGSTFANPAASVSGGAKAWQLIDKAGCRGLVRGGAQVSELHCNFLINTGNATAADLEGLGEEVRRRVMENSGVKLEWEIRRLGRHAEALS